jgi:tetratricopeptide (TPR) repeat protein
MSYERQEIFITEFDSLYRAQNWEKVLQYCDTADYYQLKVPYQIPKAEAYIGLGKYDESIMYLESLSKDEKSHYITQTLGMAYWAKGDTQHAIASFEQTIALQPTYVSPYVCLGELYFQDGSKENSINYFMDAVKLFYDFQAYDEAGYYANKIVSELDSANIRPYIYLERICFMKTMYLEALKYCSVIEFLCKSEPNAFQVRVENLFNCGLNNFYLKNFDISANLIKEYLHIIEGEEDWQSPNKFYAYVALGFIYELSGDKVLAEGYLTKARNMDKQRAQDLLKYLREEINKQ